MSLLLHVTLENISWIERFDFTQSVRRLHHTTVHSSHLEWDWVVNNDKLANYGDHCTETTCPVCTGCRCVTLLKTVLADTIQFEPIIVSRLHRHRLNLESSTTLLMRLCTNTGYATKPYKVHNVPYTNTSCKGTLAIITVILLYSGNVEANPGPVQRNLPQLLSSHVESMRELAHGVPENPQ